MKNLHSFFGIITVLSLILAPFTTSTVSLYAQNTGEQDSETTAEVADLDVVSEVEDQEENVEEEETEDPEKLEAEDGLIDVDGDDESEKDEESEEPASEELDVKTDEQVLGVRAAGAEVVAQGIGDPNNKINICHRNGNSGSWNELSVDENSWGGHDNHGDFIVDENNPCPPESPVGIPVGEIDACKADLSGNKIIDQADVDYVTDHWNETCSSENNWCEGADINEDGFVGIVDLDIVLGNFGYVCANEVVSCRADVSGNGAVEQADVDYVTDHWNLICSANDDWCDGADINEDGFVGIEDLNIVLSNFGQICMETTSIEVCKIIIDEDGNIVDGSEMDAEFSISLESSNGFSKTITFDTPLTLNRDLVSDNGDALDARCVVFDDLEEGQYLYGEEEIDGEGWLTPLYNDFFSETPDSLENFYEITTDESPEDNDNADGVINLYENDKRILAIVNEYEKEDTKNQCEIGTELLENGSFESPEVEDSALWDIFDSGVANLGWFVEWVRAGGPEVASLELHKGVNGWNSADGSQHAELDGDWQGPIGGSGEDASTAIYQDVATISGEFYDLSFAFSPRPNTSESENILEVLWEGSVVETIGPDAGSSDVNWSVYTKQLKATQDGSRLEFRDAGNGNSIGTLLDDVSLVCGEEDETEEPTDQIPTVILNANPTEIESGDTSTLDWTAIGGNGDLTCSIDQEIGSVSPNGTTDVTTEYTITCNDEDGDEGTDSVTINVDEGNDNNNNNEVGTITGGYFSGGLVAGASTGQVLGTSCGIYLNDFLHIDSPNNDKMEIVKLQAFLKQFVDPDLEVTGVFDQATFDAVWDFQLQYADQIIGPWANVGLLNDSQATGYVYKTTQRQINLLVCPPLALPIPSNLAPDLDVTDNS